MVFPNIDMKNSIEEVLRQKILLDKELAITQDEKLSLGLKISSSEQKLEVLKEEHILSQKKIEELKTKILNPDYTAFLYNIVKESILGREPMLVN